MSDEERRKSETEGLEFKVQKIEFFTEDEKKMETMTVQEKIAYIRKLKAENRYVIVND